LEARENEVAQGVNAHGGVAAASARREPALGGAAAVSQNDARYAAAPV